MSKLKKILAVAFLGANIASAAELFPEAKNPLSDPVNYDSYCQGLSNCLLKLNTQAIDLAVPYEKLAKSLISHERENLKADYSRFSTQYKEIIVQLNAAESNLREHNPKKGSFLDDFLLLRSQFESKFNEMQGWKTQYDAKAKK